jgi:hypothetical protein
VRKEKMLCAADSLQEMALAKQRKKKRIKAEKSYPDER